MIPVMQIHLARHPHCAHMRLKAAIWSLVVAISLAIPGWALLGCGAAEAAAAQAPEAPQSETHLLYEAYWGGLHVADFSLSTVLGEHSFENRFELETRGLTRLFSNFSAIATSRGKRLAAPPANGMPGTKSGTGAVTNASATPSPDLYLPTRYRADYQSSKHRRWVDIGFRAPNQPARATTGTSPLPGKESKWNPKDKGPEELDKVVKAMRIGVIDPISAINQMQAGIKAHLEGGPATFTIKGFDGRRRFDLDVEYLGPVRRVVRKRPFKTYRVRVMPRPVAGFKTRHKKLWERAAFDFYLARDGSFAPIQIVPLKLGPVLSLLRRCKRPCELPKEED